MTRLCVGVSLARFEAMDHRQLRDLDQRVSILACVFGYHAIPLSLFGMFDRGLELLGQGLERFAAVDFNSFGQDSADRPKLFDAASTRWRQAGRTGSEFPGRSGS